MVCVLHRLGACDDVCVAAGTALALRPALTPTLVVCVHCTATYVVALLCMKLRKGWYCCRNALALSLIDCWRSCFLEQLLVLVAFVLIEQHSFNTCYFLCLLGVMCIVNECMLLLSSVDR